MTSNFPQTRLESFPWPGSVGAVERAWLTAVVNSGPKCSAVWGRGTNADETILKASAVWGSPLPAPVERPAAAFLRAN